MPEIGATLREARMRARIDVSEIEAQTKIRAKYLRALENEEWGLLPGPTFVKSFLRTYAQALGLDGKALVEEYRLQPRAPERRGARADRLEPAAQPRAGAAGAGARRAARRAAIMAIVGAVVLLIVLLIVGLDQQGGGSSKSSAAHTAAQRPAKTATHTAQAPRRDAGADAHAARSSRCRCTPTGGGVRLPDRRQRAQADPGQRTAGRAKARRPTTRGASRSRSATAR